MNQNKQSHLYFVTIKRRGWSGYTLSVGNLLPDNYWVKVRPETYEGVLSLCSHRVEPKWDLFPTSKEDPIIGFRVRPGDAEGLALTQSGQVMRFDSKRGDPIGSQDLPAPEYLMTELRMGKDETLRKLTLRNEGAGERIFCVSGSVNWSFPNEDEFLSLKDPIMGFAKCVLPLDPAEWKKESTQPDNEWDLYRREGILVFRKSGEFCTVDSQTGKSCEPYPQFTNRKRVGCSKENRVDFRWEQISNRKRKFDPVYELLDPSISPVVETWKRLKPRLIQIESDKSYKRRFAHLLGSLGTCMPNWCVFSDKMDHSSQESCSQSLGLDSNRFSFSWEDAWQNLQNLGKEMPDSSPSNPDCLLQLGKPNPEWWTGDPEVLIIKGPKAHWSEEWVNSTTKIDYENLTYAEMLDGVKLRLVSQYHKIEDGGVSPPMDALEKWDISGRMVWRLGREDLPQQDAWAYFMFDCETARGWLWSMQGYLCEFDYETGKLLSREWLP